MPSENCYSKLPLFHGCFQIFSRLKFFCCPELQHVSYSICSKYSLHITMNNSRIFFFKSDQLKKFSSLRFGSLPRHGRMDALKKEVTHAATLVAYCWQFRMHTIKVYCNNKKSILQAVLRKISTQYVVMGLMNTAVKCAQ